MGYCLITFRSVTWAQRAEALIRRIGYQCSMRRTSRLMEAQGCGYSLRIPAEHISVCVNKLKATNISYQKVYRYNELGELEELQI